MMESSTDFRARGVWVTFGGMGVRMKIESLTLKIICDIFASRDVTCTCADLAYIETKSSPELTC